MLNISTMHAGTDEFHFRKRALLKSKNCLDFTYDTSVNKFEIGGTEPENTSRRVIFKIDDKLYYFGNSGLTEYERRGEIEDILEYGNTVGELLSLENVNEFAGKKVFPIIALDAPADSPVFPKIKLSVKVNSYNDVYTKYIYSPVYTLPGNAKIYDIKESKFTNGNGSATVQCQLDGAGDWLYTVEAAGKTASKIQFRTQFILSTLDGSDFAKVNSVKTFYTTDKDKLSGSTMEIISLPQDYPDDLKTFAALIKHSELVDCEIKAYVNIFQTLYRENVFQTPNGETLYLSFNGVVDKNISADSIRLFDGDKPVTDFYFDTENSSVNLLQLPTGEIFASYESTTAENWQELQGDSSRFTLNSSLAGKIAAVKFVITRFSGVSDSLQIGIGTGKLQTFALPHRAKAETLTCSAPFKYDEEGQILKVVAPIDEPIYISYEWQGQFPKIYSYIWGAAVS